MTWAVPFSDETVRQTAHYLIESEYRGLSVRACKPSRIVNAALAVSHRDCSAPKCKVCEKALTIRRNTLR